MKSSEKNHLYRFGAKNYMKTIWRSYIVVESINVMYFESCRDAIYVGGCYYLQTCCLLSLGLISAPTRSALFILGGYCYSRGLLL